MVDSAKVSVIVPVYNVENYLERCISSIAGQTYPMLQIILVDDGSVDGSGDICDRYREQDSRIIVIHKRNGGLVSARKTGLSYAIGKYACYVDGDDWVESDLVERLLEEMEKTEADLAVSDFWVDISGSSKRVRGRQQAGVYAAENVIPIMLYTGVFYEFGISQFAWAKLYRKDILQKVQEQVDDRITCGEDVALVYPYILRTQKICCIDYAGYHYLHRSDSMTNLYESNEWAKNRILLRYLQSVFKGSAYVRSLYGQLNQFAKNLLLARCVSCFDSPGADKVLLPYGGIALDGKIVLYGAGKLGQSIYCYLREQLVTVVCWLDINYIAYREQNMDVHPPQMLISMDEQDYDFVVIGVSSQQTAGNICTYLESIGVHREKIRWLTMDFVKEEYSVLNWIEGDKSHKGLGWEGQMP